MKKQKVLYRCDLAFGLALLVKVFGLGFTYFPVLDDYIQYGSYPLYDLGYVYGHIGTVAFRPFSALLDPAFWGLFWQHMWVALLLITILHFLSAVFLDRVLTKLHVKITPILYCGYLLLPLTFEGSYWISASSRIIVGIFFAALATWVLQYHLKTNKKWVLPFYAVFCFLSLGFYESVAVFSILLQVWSIWKLTADKETHKKRLLLIIPAVSVLLLLLYYKIFANFGAAGSRVSEFSLSGMGGRILSLFSQFGYIFSVGLIRTTITGFFDSLDLFALSPIWGLCLTGVIVFTSALCAFFSKKHHMHAKAKVCVPLGLVMMLLPLVPNLLVSEVWLTYRSIMVCIPGLCVLISPLCAKGLKNRYIRMIVTFALVFFFSLGCVNELQTYKHVHTMDNVLLDNVVAHLNEDVLAGEKETVLVLPEEVILPQTSYYKDHVKSVFCADWSLTGAVRAKTQNNNIKMITPVYSLEDTDTTGKYILVMDVSYTIVEEING